MGPPGRPRIGSSPPVVISRPQMTQTDAFWIMSTSARRLSFAATLIASLLLSAPTLAEPGGQPRTVLLRQEYLDLARQRWLEGDPIIGRTVDRMIAIANAKMSAGPYSVVFSKLVAPSGDPHDYVSYGAYWWPNPDTPDGLPWISRDGHINKDNLVDGRNLCNLKRASEPLALAYYFTGEQRYAEKAASLIRTWFLDEETSMNPRNDWAVIIPGVNSYYDVAGFGNCMPLIFDAAGILESSPAWTTEDRVGLQAWTREFADWAASSRRGALQFNEPSNHGTNFDFLQAVFSLYHEDVDTAEQSIKHYFFDRLPIQMALDGSNPLEMRRANNLQYHWYNLGRAFDIAELARFVDDFDPYEYEMQDGRGLKLGWEFLAPYLAGDQPWEFWNDNEFKREPAVYFELFRRAAIAFQDPQLLDISDSFGYRSSFYYSQFLDVTFPREAVNEPLLGDFDGDGSLTVLDIDRMAERMRAPVYYSRYDTNDDGVVDLFDRQQVIQQYFGSSFGDANLDGRFESIDLVEVFAAGGFEDGIPSNASWASGDWDGDGDFTSTDLLVALQAGRYEAPGPVPAAVPEPVGLLILIASAAPLLRYVSSR